MLQTRKQLLGRRCIAEQGQNRARALLLDVHCGIVIYVGLLLDRGFAVPCTGDLQVDKVEYRLTYGLGTLYVFEIIY